MTDTKPDDGLTHTTIEFYPMDTLVRRARVGLINYDIVFIKDIPLGTPYGAFGTKGMQVARSYVNRFATTHQVGMATLELRRRPKFARAAPLTLQEVQDLIDELRSLVEKRCHTKLDKTERARLRTVLDALE